MWFWLESPCVQTTLDEVYPEAQYSSMCVIPDTQKAHRFCLLDYNGQHNFRSNFVMKKTKTIRQGSAALALVLTFLFGVPLMADTIELADGSIIEGDFVGSSNGIIMFNTGDGIEAYPEDQVTGVFFSSGVQTAAAQASAPQRPITTVPAGTRLVIRTVEDVDTRRHQAGHRFRGQLENAITVDGVTVAPRGTFVHGVISAASSGGNVAGSANLSMEFTDLLIDDDLYPIATTAMQAQSANEAGRTVRRTARASAVGALVDGKSGARTGMKVGAGVSVLTSGASINVPRGTLLETTLRTPLVIQ